MTPAPDFMATLFPGAVASVPLAERRMLAFYSDTLLNAFTAALYSANNDEWTRLAPPPTDVLASSGVVAEVLGDRVLFWSFESASGLVFHPDTETWTEVGVTEGVVSTHRVVVNEQLVSFVGGSVETADYAVGYRFDPNDNEWSEIDSTPNLVPRTATAQVVIEDGLFVWGGNERIPADLTAGVYPDQPVLGDGAILHADTWRWEPVSGTGAPSPRAGAITAWTGEEIILYGGYARVEWANTPVEPLSDGYRYDPSANAWEPIDTTNAPAISSGQAAWTGERLFVFGASPLDSGTATLGGLYDPVRDVWELLDMPEDVSHSDAVFADPAANRVVVLHRDSSIHLLDAMSKLWTSTPLPQSKLAAYRPVSTWLGHSLLLWGGHVDVTDPNQCQDLPPDVIGCDPIYTYEALLDGYVFHASCLEF